VYPVHKIRRIMNLVPFNLKIRRESDTMFMVCQTIVIKAAVTVNQERQAKRGFRSRQE
jgi:hypothetical protein